MRPNSDIDANRKRTQKIEYTLFNAKRKLKKYPRIVYQ